MKLRPDQLADHTLLPVYLICGDDPLLTSEAQDQVRQNARAAGFLRTVLHVESGFDWDQLRMLNQTLSIFSDKQLIDLRFSSKPDAAAQKAIQEYCASYSVNNILLISAPKLDATNLRAKWVSALEQVGALVVIWPLRREDLPRWIQARAKSLGMRLAADAVQRLIETGEGNLLSIKQELEHLHLLHGSGQISLAQIDEVIAQSARYSAFDWIDAALQGDPARVARIWKTLQEEGSEQILLNWALSKEVRILGQILHARTQGQAESAVFTAQRIHAARQQLHSQALRRITLREWRALTTLSMEIDQANKGQRPDDPWLLLLRAGLLLAGKRIL